MKGRNGKALPLKRRFEIAEAYASGEKMILICMRFGVCRTTVQRSMRRLKIVRRRNGRPLRDAPNP